MILSQYWMNSYTKKYQEWKILLKEAHLEMSLSHCKHSNKILLITGLETVFWYRDLLFERCSTNVGRMRILKYSHINRKWWQGQSIHSKGLTNRISRLCMEMVRSDRKNRSCERSVPAKWFKEVTKNRFRDTFEEVDEHRSSKICPECCVHIISWWRGKEGRHGWWCFQPLKLCSTHIFIEADI